MRWEVLLSFLSAALVAQLVPGPGMLFILASGVARGALGVRLLISGRR
jgi:threonine/homoserine/homoserine lactone efflux protein